MAHSRHVADAGGRHHLSLVLWLSLPFMGSFLLSLYQAASEVGTTQASGSRRLGLSPDRAWATGQLSLSLFTHL